MIRILLLLLVLAAPAWAAESARVQSERVTASLISDTDRVEAGKPFRIGLWLRIAPGWHTYWQNPGDAGAAPEISLAAAKAGPIDWPTPVRLPEGPLMTYGYTGQVLLPMQMTAGPGSVHIE